MNPLRSAAFLLVLALPSVADKPSNPPVLGEWRAPPTLVVCETYEEDLRDVRRALEKIHMHGGRGRMRIAEESGAESCLGALAINGGPARGEIWLVGWDPHVFDPAIAGLTFLNSEGWWIRDAVVFVDLNHGSAVLEHELLHAWGLGHTEGDAAIGSILAPSLDIGRLDGGPSWKGIRL